MDLQHRLRFRKSTVAVTFTRLDGDEFQVRIFFSKASTNVLDPLVLIRST